MTRTKLWRLSLAAILGFGWLFLTPAYSDDPLVVAAQDIQDLKFKVNDLNYKDQFIELIEVSENKYNIAVSAKSDMNSKSSVYDAAVISEALALEEKNNAQSAVNNQTSIVATKLQEKNSAYNTLTSANISLLAAKAVVDASQNLGVSFQIFPLARAWGWYAYIPEGAGVMCQGSIPSFDIWAGSGAICGLHDNIIGIFKAKLTIPEGINDVYFAGATDDGFRLYINGILETEQWIEQGTDWSPYTRHFDVSTNKVLNLEAWWYNGGGPGNMTIGWGYNGIWTGIPSEYLSYGSGATQQQIDAYNAAVTAQATAQSNYNTKLASYNSANSTLTTYNQTLNTKTTAYSIAQTNTSNALTAKNNAIDTYNQSIIDMNAAILEAKEYYEEQLSVETAAAIAQALANQPQPTPEPTIQPSPEPSPEQTQPDNPSPSPEPEITDEETPEPSSSPEPSQESSPEPSPQPTDINPTPTSEPTVSPTKDPEIIKVSPEEITTENVSGLLADLTSKDTLTKLTSEQKAAVASVLGIKTEEIAKVAELAKSNPIIAKALEEFSDRVKENADALMPYTLADATTELAAENLLADPIGALTNIDFEKVFDTSQWGKDMTDDQRKKAQEVVIPVIIASNIVAAAMTRRI